MALKEFATESDLTRFKRNLTVITVEYDDSIVGATITVTDNGNYTYTQTAPAGGKCVFMVDHLGEWHISEDRYESGNTVVTTYYGRYRVSIGGKIFLKVTYDPEFIGSTIEVTNGIRTYRKLATNDLEVTFVMKDTGKWTISGVIDGKTFETSVSIPADGNYEATLHNVKGFEYGLWLVSAGMSETAYSSLEELLADEKAIRTLMIKHSSVDYLVASLEDDQANAEILFNNFYVAKWTNLSDYALDKLSEVETIKTVMDATGWYGYGEIGYVGKVPVMTSNTAPSGEAIYSTQLANAYQAFNVFSGDISKYWYSNYEDSNARIGYKSTVPVKINKIMIYPHYYLGIGVEDFDVCGSNDGTNWDVLYSGTIANVSESEKRHEFYFNNNTEYIYHSLRIKSFYCSTEAKRLTACLRELQFYAIEPLGLVPKMTGNNAPYGEIAVTDTYSGSAAFKAFDGNPSTMWISNGITNKSIAYKFVNPVCVKRVLLERNADKRIKSYKVQASNDNTTWDDLTERITFDNNKLVEEIELDNNKYYLYYRVYIFDSVNGGNYYIAVNTLQFYGRELKVSVPKMTSNTAPWGEIKASSQYSSDYSSVMAFDNNLSKAWLSQSGDSIGSYIGYDFGRKTNVKFVVVTNVDNASYQVSKATLQGYNNGVWEDIADLNITNRSLKGISHFVINNNKGYSEYRMLTKEINAGGYCGYTELQFYGLDYSEKEFDTNRNVKYIYDHGVELMELGAFGNAIKNTDNLSIVHTSNSGHSEFWVKNKVTEHYNRMRAIVHNNFSYNSYAPFIGCNNEAGTSSPTVAVLARPTAGDLPYLWSLDLSNVNLGDYYIKFAQNAYITNADIDEWWLE